MTIYYKAVRPDGTDWYSGTVRWLPEDLTIPDGGWLVEHPNPAAKIGKRSGADAFRYLSVATVPTDCTGMRWPSLLLAVESVGRACLDADLPNKRRVKAARVVDILPAHKALGPQGAHVAAIIERARGLTCGELDRLASARASAYHAAWYAAWYAAWDAARYAARYAAWDAARYAARYAAWDAAWDAARDAAIDTAIGTARALVVRDLISAVHYDTLTIPWRTAIGRIHPDDTEEAS